jgi:hypothetical protein
MHVLWVNDHADFVGAVSRYPAETATLLRPRGVRSTLLYGVPGWTEPRFTSMFDAAFPYVAPRRQVRELAPDIITVHALADDALLRELVACGPPVVRFVHDHRQLGARRPDGLAALVVGSPELRDRVAAGGLGARRIHVIPPEPERHLDALLALFQGLLQP